MMDMINTFIDNTLQSLGVMGPIVGCFFITIESILPILPLFVFITLNFLAFGNILGFIISWFFTCLGCFLSFLLFRVKVQNYIYRKLKMRGINFDKGISVISNLKFEQLTTIIAMPFTPAFLVNIVAGLSKMSSKKFICALLIGKVFLVYFWGFVGVSLLESIKNPIYLVRVGILVLVAYIVSKIVNKRFNFN